jgi:hypothetical protein
MPPKPVSSMIHASIGPLLQLLPQPLQTRLIAAGAFLRLETKLLGGGDDIGEEIRVSLSRIGPC